FGTDLERRVPQPAGSAEPSMQQTPLSAIRIGANAVASRDGSDLKIISCSQPSYSGDLRCKVRVSQQPTMSRPKLLAILCLAVAAAVRIMEDDRQFNAGRGAVLNHDGDAELDAAIMDGHGPRAGAVAGVRHVKNPVELARLVMEKSPHVLLVAEGAEEFAREQ